MNKKNYDKFSKEDIIVLLKMNNIDTTEEYRFVCDDEFFAMSREEEAELDNYPEHESKSGYSIYYGKMKK